jgi:hypothetical protein
MIFRTAGLWPAHDHDAGQRPAVRKISYSTTLPPRVVQLTTSVVGVQP